MSGPGDAEIRSAPPSMARHARWKPEQAPNKSRGRPAMPDDRGNTPKRIGREVLPAPGSGKLTTDYRNSVATWNCCEIDTRPAGAGLRLKHAGRDRQIAFAEAVALDSQRRHLGAYGRLRAPAGRSPFRSIRSRPR